MSKSGFHESMSERQRLLLSLVVENYIASAEAIGSRTLTEILHNAVSSATVRNELSELDRMGFLEQPHTSAGRIPTVNGYRFYIDNLMHSRALTPAERSLADERLSSIKAGSMEEYVSKACGALASVTGSAAVALSPDIGATIRRVEYFPMSPSSGVAAVLTSSGLIRSRIAATEEPVSTAMLYRFLQAANGQLTNKLPAHISHWDYSIIAQATGGYARLFTPVLEAMAELIGEVSVQETYFAGQNHLISAVGAEKATAAIRALSEGDQLKTLLAAAENPRVIMGTETGRNELACVSFVLAPYECRGMRAGAVGIVTARRTDYSKLLPFTDYFARRLGSMLA